MDTITLDKPLVVKINNDTICKTIVYYNKTENGTFIMYYRDQFAGDDTSLLVLTLTFWAFGIHGTIDVNSVKPSTWNSNLKKAIYVPKRDWNKIFYFTDVANPNYSSRGRRGYSARWNWESYNVEPVFEIIKPSKKIESFKEGYFNTCVKGSPEDFNDFFDFLNYHGPHLLDWIEEDKQRT